MFTGRLEEEGLRKRKQNSAAGFATTLGEVSVPFVTPQRADVSASLVNAAKGNIAHYANFKSKNYVRKLFSVICFVIDWRKVNVLTNIWITRNEKKTAVWILRHVDLLLGLFLNELFCGEGSVCKLDLLVQWQKK